VTGEQQKEDKNMRVTLPAFTPMQESLFLTLCGRALDNHLRQPILGDPMATQLVGRLGYDCGRFHLRASPILNIALRAKKLDQVAQAFIGRHPNAVGLDLGPGSTPGCSASTPRPRSTGTTSTTPRSSPPAGSCSQPAPTPTTSAPISPTRTGWTPSPPAGRR
jgi:hypothetical protein